MVPAGRDPIFRTRFCSAKWPSLRWARMQGRLPPRALGLALGEETEMGQPRLSGDQLRMPDGHWTG